MRSEFPIADGLYCRLGAQGSRSGVAAGARRSRAGAQARQVRGGGAEQSLAKPRPGVPDEVSTRDRSLPQCAATGSTTDLTADRVFLLVQRALFGAGDVAMIPRSHKTFLMTNDAVFRVQSARLTRG
jgi:phage-related tail fiber protein